MKKLLFLAFALMLGLSISAASANPWHYCHGRHYWHHGHQWNGWYDYDYGGRPAFDFPMVPQ